MKCPWCGAVSEVLETRDRQKSGTYRTRMCFGKHRFATVESYVDYGLLVIQRDKSIAAAVHAGARRLLVARQFGVSKRTVDRAATKYEKETK